MQNSKNVVRLLLLSAAFLLLAIGGLIYMLYRPQVLLMHILADYMDLSGWVNTGRLWADSYPLPKCVVYNIPGALWSTAYILISEALFCYRSISFRWKWAAVVPVIGAVSECVQAADLLPGQFDGMDLFCYLFPYLLYLALTRSNAK